MGRRIEKSSSATTSVFAYDGDNLIEETNTSGRVVLRKKSIRQAFFPRDLADK
jgi:hypothetical protein